MKESSSRRALAIAVAVAFCLAGCESSPDVAARQGQSFAKGPTSTGWQVTDVVDGDTVHVSRDDETLTIRLIGIDTPETVHPTEPVECYGPEASAFAQRTLDGADVILEYDPSQGRLDVYDRTLAYVWLDTAGGQRLFNELAVRRGFATEYTYDDPYAWQQRFVRAQDAAQRNQRGLWGACR
jgi:micrococcal nuclease